VRSAQGWVFQNFAGFFGRITRNKTTLPFFVYERRKNNANSLRQGRNPTSHEGPRRGPGKCMEEPSILFHRVPDVSHRELQKCYASSQQSSFSHFDESRAPAAVSLKFYNVRGAFVASWRATAAAPPGPLHTAVWWEKNRTIRPNLLQVSAAVQTPQQVGHAVVGYTLRPTAQLLWRASAFAWESWTEQGTSRRPARTVPLPHTRSVKDTNSLRTQILDSGVFRISPDPGPCSLDALVTYVSRRIAFVVSTHISLCTAVKAWIMRFSTPKSYRPCQPHGCRVQQ